MGVDAPSILGAKTSPSANRAKRPARSAPKGPYYFDKALADAAVDFFPRFLCFVDGEWAGKPFRLSPWEEHDVRQLFGWRRRSNGLRRYRFARIWVPRKNGKTELAAGLGHLLTIGDGEPGAQVYSHALQGDQAALCVDKAGRMAALSPALNRTYEVTAKGLFCPATFSNFRWLSGEAYGKHGLSPHANIGDEAHAWRNGKLHTFLIQGMGARRQPLDITISTAGEIKTYGHELYLASKAILNDPSLDPETYVSIYEAEPTDDWTDPKVWAKANPNIGISLKPEFLDAECKRAQATPRLENDFKRYHLNLWVEQAVRWFPMRKWPENTAAPSDRGFWRELPQRFLGGRRKAYLGLDLGSTSDITAAVWVFPAQDGSERVTMIPRFWVPVDKVEERDSPRTPYRRWIDEGALLTTPGNVTDYDFIEQAICEDAARFGCAGIAYDPWNATQVAVHLQSEGLPCQEFRQGYGSMAAPSKELERLFMSGQLEHGNHPVLEWMFGNATYRKDPAGNIKPDKEKAAEKIDGVVAAAMGLGLSIAQDDDASIYSSERGLIVVAI
jgi:phage terminase large subunit-like protein